MRKAGDLSLLHNSQSRICRNGFAFKVRVCLLIPLQESLSLSAELNYRFSAKAQKTFGLNSEIFENVFGFQSSDSKVLELPGLTNQSKPCSWESKWLKLLFKSSLPLKDQFKIIPINLNLNEDNLNGQYCCWAVWVCKLPPWNLKLLILFDRTPIWRPAKSSA